MNIAREIGRFLPPGVKGWARYVRGSHEDFYPFGTAMNGQTARLEATREIFYKCQIKLIIETGTFRGTTTEWLARLGAPVISVELHPPSYEFSKRRLAQFGNVSLKLGNSVDVLRSVLPQCDPAAPTLIYLDAHWEDYLPLREEIDLISSRLENFAIIVDDFQVPGDSGYTFDDYGPGKALTEDYLRGCKNRQLEKFYPAVPSIEETGNRRGWIVLTANKAIVAILNSISLLRQAA